MLIVTILNCTVQQDKGSMNPRTEQVSLGIFAYKYLSEVITVRRGSSSEGHQERFLLSDEYISVRSSHNSNSLNECLNIYAEYIISDLHVKHIALDGQIIRRSNKKHKGVHTYPLDLSSEI